MDKNIPKQIVDMILTNNKPEDFIVDWIEGVENQDSVGEKISAFATSEGGWLIIGITKQKYLRGIGNEQVLISKMGEVLRKCHPIPPVGNPEFVEKEDKKIAVYKIPSLGGTICEYKEIPYHRVQDSVKKMTLKEITHRLTICGVLSWEERPSEAELNQIDNEELEYYLKKVNDRNRLENKTAEHFLFTHKAITKAKNHLTNLGLITLAKKPSNFLPQCKIQLVRFKGNKPIDRIAAYLTEFPARKMITNCLDFIKLNLPIKEHYEGTNRIEEPVIPEKALREAVVNMVVHRDYNDPQESLIRIFDDRIEFQNAGAPDKEGLQKILSQGIPFHRNQGIYNFLRPVHQAEAAGQGIPIMKKELKRVGLKEPEITTLYNIFHVTMRFEESGPETLEDVILMYGREKRKISTSDIMHIYALSRPTAIKILNELVRKGFARHIGKRRNSKYVF